jgi:hypothetical protein
MDWEEEPFLSANPAKAGKLAVAWMQDWSDAIVVGFLTDGGATWTSAARRARRVHSNSIRKAIAGGGK